MSLASMQIKTGAQRAGTGVASYETTTINGKYTTSGGTVYLTDLVLSKSGGSQQLKNKSSTYRTLSTPILQKNPKFNRKFPQIATKYGKIESVGKIEKEKNSIYDAILPVPKRFTNKSLNTKSSSIGKENISFSSAPSRNNVSSLASSANTFAYSLSLRN